MCQGQAESFFSPVLPQGWRGSCHGAPCGGTGGDPHGTELNFLLEEL